MSTHLFSAGVNVIAYKKDNHRYGMTCSWATMIDYDIVGMLLGFSSATAKHLQVGDEVGISALSKLQADIAMTFGNGHSDEIDKFKNTSFLENNSAILIQNARIQMVGKVINILHIPDDSPDFFLVIKVKSVSENKKEKFLLLEDVSH